jgi:DNA-binding GntR family transcriptional regulator
MDQLLTRPVLAAKASTQERIRAAIEAEILSGERPPGSPIDEKALAAGFNTSRTPVREALMLLAAQGLVSIAPRVGISVRQPSAAELAALLEALGELESVLARLAARRIAAPAQASLKRALDKSSKCAAAEDRRGYEGANAALHEQIYAASGNPVLVDQVRGIRKRLSAYRQRGFDQPGRLRTSDQEHHEIVGTICSGDELGAAEAMRLHISMGGEALTALLRASAQT